MSNNAPPGLEHNDSPSLSERIDQMPWDAITDSLDTWGCAVLPKVFTPAECQSLAALYPYAAPGDIFRSHIHMARHGFGRGEYKYFSYPLPPQIAELRTCLYSHLAPIANRWNESLREQVSYPQELAAYLEICHAAGQTRPTPLLLQYVEGDFNALHQDLYGDHVFPFQVAFLLSKPGEEFTGGEFVLTEQRPRMQSRAEVVALGQGDAVIFAVRHRPVMGNKGFYWVNLKHGVSRIRSGRRHTMGIIFHDAN